MTRQGESLPRLFHVRWQRNLQKGDWDGNGKADFHLPRSDAASIGPTICDKIRDLDLKSEERC
jgi:hypothetical protein